MEDKNLKGKKYRWIYQLILLFLLILFFVISCAYWLNARRHLFSNSQGMLPLIQSVPALPQRFSLVLAGRDVIYCGYHLRCANQEQRTGVQQTSETDSIMLLQIDGTHIHILNIPRDTNVGPFDPHKSVAEQKINSRYWTGGPKALMQAVEQVTGEPVNHYMIIRTDFAARVIDALGGLDVDVPPGGVSWTDRAADVDFHLSAGPHHLNGEQGVLFLRVRKGFGDDYGRMDHQKQALAELLSRLKSPQGLLAVPVLLRGLSDGIETDLSPATLSGALPRFRRPQLDFATLPTQPIPHSYNLAVDSTALKALWTTPSSSRSSSNSLIHVIIFDESGRRDGQTLLKRLRSEGYRHIRLVRQPQSQQGSAVFTADNIPAAQKLANKLNMPVLQGERFPVRSGEVAVLLSNSNR